MLYYKLNINLDTFSSRKKSQEMAGGRPTRSQIRVKQIKEEIWQTAVQRQVEWQSASPEAQDVAHQNFLSALQSLAAFVVDGKLPADYSKRMGRLPSTQLQETARAARISGD